MQSRNARFLKRALAEEFRRMTPAQRVRAFIEHSRILIRIKAAGEARRKAAQQGRKGDASSSASVMRPRGA